MDMELIFEITHRSLDKEKKVEANLASILLYIGAFISARL